MNVRHYLAGCWRSCLRAVKRRRRTGGPGVRHRRAVVGGTLCELTSNDHGKCAAVAICLRCAGATRLLRLRQEAGVRKQALRAKSDLDAQIRYVRDLNADTEKLNGQLAERVSALTRETDSVVKQSSDVRSAAGARAQEAG